jgi:hypothetical protein
VTTSLYFDGAGGQTLGQHGYSKDHRPDLRQMILAVLLDGREVILADRLQVAAIAGVADRRFAVRGSYLYPAKSIC